ncbi:MAG: acyl-CoA reductase, partial [Gillisia sp.]
MYPPLEKRINAFIELGRQLKKIKEPESDNNLSVAEINLLNEVKVSHLKNPWFTPYNVMSALAGLSDMLEENKIREWIANYKIDDLALPHTIAVIMAGNLPMVGFHDFMCVLLSGNKFLGKLSGQDKKLPVKIAELLIETEPGFKP